MASLQQDAADDGLARWRELKAPCDLLQAASLVAWANVMDAYRATVLGDAFGEVLLHPDEAMVQFRTAKALQTSAEEAMLAFIQASCSSRPG